MTTESFSTHITLGSHYWSILLAFNVLLISYSYITSSCCLAFILMATVKKESTLHVVWSMLLSKDCLVTPRNEVHLRCDGSEAAAQLPLIKRGCHVKSLGPSATKPVATPPFPKSWCCRGGLLLTTGGKWHSTLCQQGGLEACLLSKGLGFILRQQALTGIMTGWRLGVPSDHDMVQIYKSNWSLAWLPGPQTKPRWFTSLCPSSPTNPL